MASRRLLVHSATQVVQVVNNGERVLTGPAMKKLEIIQRTNEDGVSIVIDSKGNIEAIGLDGEVKKTFKNATYEKTIDATGMSIIPGLVDGHTHPVWAGDRVHEFAMKLAGATYMEVHESGGGIHYTVEHTRKATEDELLHSLKSRLWRMLKSGTTLVECKSGYGLNADTEIKMLQVIERAKRKVPIDISSTYCGAHAVPKGSSASEATKDVIDVQIPRIHKLMQEEKLHVDNIDVFCELGVFNVEQTKQILEAGKNIGLQINFHGDELHPIKSAEMGADLGATAISHLEEVSDLGIEKMAESGTIAVILPTTAYILRLNNPPVRKMLASGVAVALGSDFNPNAYCLSMPLVMHLACVNLHMTMNEALVAATLNAAASVGKSSTHGSLEVGKYGDMVILDEPKWENMIYQLGGHNHVIKHVIKQGKVVV
ncbi:unnamed protein product [Owenia fusiformis]|uniref:Probable imidazolonepropionase n=1 Tax=Owenia fusiformis TaxID=6347 RepID=A0A8S4NNX3_OWEFU|nr:unnamed protein product [Owenia fusiformis]